MNHVVFRELCSLLLSNKDSYDEVRSIDHGATIVSRAVVVFIVVVDAE